MCVFVPLQINSTYQLLQSKCNACSDSAESLLRFTLAISGLQHTYHVMSSLWHHSRLYQLNVYIAEIQLQTPPGACLYRQAIYTSPGGMVDMSGGLSPSG